jgi:hypothetical protein
MGYYRTHIGERFLGSSPLANNTCGEQVVADWVRKHGFRLLSRRSFALWRLTLGVKDFQAPEWAAAAKGGMEW